MKISAPSELYGMQTAEQTPPEGEVAHRKHMKIGSSFAYREGRPAPVISPVSSVVANSDNFYIIGIFYCTIYLVRRNQNLTVTDPVLSLSPPLEQCASIGKPQGQERSQGKDNQIVQEEEYSQPPWQPA